MAVIAAALFATVAVAGIADAPEGVDPLGFVNPERPRVERPHTDGSYRVDVPDYQTTDVVQDKSFPISYIYAHWAYSTYASSWKPVVAFNSFVRKYQVAWRETPGPEAQNDTKVNHIREFLQKGHKVTVFAPEPENGHREDGVQYFRSISYKRYPGYTISPFPTNKCEILRDLGVDVIHTHGVLFMGVRSMFAARTLEILPLQTISSDRMQSMLEAILRGQATRKTTSKTSGRTTSGVRPTATSAKK